MPAPWSTRVQRLWWLYIAFGLLCLAWAGYGVSRRHPGWAVEAGLQSVIGLCMIAVGAIWLWQRRTHGRAG